MIGDEQEVRHPKGVEEVAGADLFLPVVLAQVEELKDVGVPWLEVDGERAGALVATLVDITRCSIICAEHRNDAVRVTVRAGDVSARSRISMMFRSERRKHAWNSPS